MSKILVASLQVGGGASKGHIHPMVGVVQRLVGDGHDVAWMSVPHRMGESDRAQVIRTGATVLDPLAVPGPDASALAALASNPTRAWEAYRSFLLDPLAVLVRAFGEAIEREQPDVVAADSLAYAAIIAARRAGVPLASVCAGLKLAAENSLSSAYRFDLTPLAAPRREAFARYGVDISFHVLEALSPDLVVLFSTRDLIGDVRLPARTLLAGPSRAEGARGDETSFPWNEIHRERPLVYAAFGSVHSRELLDDVILPFARAARRLGHQLVVASEALVGTTHPDLAGAVVVPYAPQLELLAAASTFLTHGGANSVTEGLDRGVPLVVVPLSGDQPIQAGLVARAGAGIALDRRHVTDASAFAALTDAARCRFNARAIQEAWRGCDGGAAAARAIAELGA